MRKINVISLLAVFVLVASISAAQEHEAGKAMKPQFSVMIREQIDLGHYEDYVEGTKKWIELIKAEGYPLMFYSFRDMNGGQYYMMPISSMAEIDEKAGVWYKAAAKLRETEWGQKRQAAVKSSKYSIWMMPGQMSYMPTASEQMPYMEWIDIRVSHSNEKEFGETIMAIKELYTQHSVERGFGVYKNIVGEEGPLYTVVFSGKDPADVYNYSRELQTKLEKEMAPLRKKVWSLSSEMTSGRGWVSPKLSLIPDQK